MNRLRKAVRDYLKIRRSLGFKLVRHETGLHEFVSFLARRSSPHITVKLALEWATKDSNHKPYERGSASCAASRGTGVRRIPRQKFRHSVCCPTDRRALDHTSIPITKSKNC